MLAMLAPVSCAAEIGRCGRVAHTGRLQWCTSLAPKQSGYSRELLGVRLVAYVGGVKSARSVSSWADGAGEPGEKDRERLRHAYHAAALLCERYDATTVQSWFKGMNPALGDAAPAQLLRDGDPFDGAREVIAAAKSFATLG